MAGAACLFWVVSRPLAMLRQRVRKGSQATHLGPSETAPLVGSTTILRVLFIQNA